MLPPTAAIWTTGRAPGWGWYAPDLIFVFRGPILRCSKGDLRAEVKRVVWHEVAHWLGYVMVAKIKKGGGRYKYNGITGSHRATAAMNIGIPIPAVFVSPADVTRKQWKSIMTHSEGLDTLFDEAKMPTAAGLMRQELELGGTAAKVEPPKREKTEGRRFRPKRVEPC
jgi:hypothetical protein